MATPGYCWYNHDSATYPNNPNHYGAIYNWHTVNTGILCPTGWHVPTDGEWTILINYLGGAYIAGGKLKETGMTHWHHPNSGASNEYGFTALPGGYRRGSGTFENIGYEGDWWSSTESGTNSAWDKGMGYDHGSVYSYDDHKSDGFSIRCLRD